MKNLTVGVIAILLVVAVLDMAEGKLAHAKIDHGKSAPEDHWSYNPKYEAFLACIKEHGGTADDLFNFTQLGTDLTTPIMKCVAGCLSELEKFTTNGELNKDNFIRNLIVHNFDEAYATKEADECEARLAELPKGDICERGRALDLCIWKSLPADEVALQG